MYWVFMGLVIAGIFIAGAINRRSRFELLRAAVEKGQTLDPALVDRLLGAASVASNGSRPNPMRVVTGLQVAAIMVGTVGGGFVLTGIIGDEPRQQVLAVASLIVCVCIGLYLSSLLVKRRIRTTDRTQ